MTYENLKKVVAMKPLTTVYYKEDESSYDLTISDGALVFNSKIFKTELYATVEEYQRVAEEGGDPNTVLRIKGGLEFSGDVATEKVRSDDFEQNIKSGAIDVS